MVHPKTNGSAAGAMLFPFADPLAWREDEAFIAERGEGIHVFDRNGNRYIEAMSALWCAGLGFSDETLIEAAVTQLRTLPSYHNFMGKACAPAIELARRLTAMAPPSMDHVFFANSGSEAVDTAVKLVWYFQNAKGRPGKKKLIARTDAYHGSGILSGSLSGMASVHAGFDLPVDLVLRTGSPHYIRHCHPGEEEREFSRRRARELEDLILAEGPETIAAFFGEPVVGSGGVLIPPEGYWDEIQAVLHRHDILLVADEVISGFGRTGAMFGVEACGIKPALMTLAKQLSAGYQPISAVLIRDDIYDVIAADASRRGSFGHGFTYSGHPVAAAVALAALDRYEELDIVGRVKRLGSALAAGLAPLRSHSVVLDVRCIGLLAAVEFAPGAAAIAALGLSAGASAAPVVAEAQRRGVIFRPLGDVVAICPPMIIDEAGIADICRVLTESITIVFGEAGQLGAPEPMASPRRPGWSSTAGPEGEPSCPAFN